MRFKKRDSQPWSVHGIGTRVWSCRPRVDRFIKTRFGGGDLQHFFVFSVFVAFSLCDFKRGTPNPGLSMGPTPVFGPAAPCVDRFSKTRFGGGDL